MLKHNNKNRYSFRSEQDGNKQAWYRKSGVGLVVFMLGLVGSLYHPSAPSAATTFSHKQLQQEHRNLKGADKVAIGRRLIVEQREYFVSTTSLEREVSVHDQEVREANADEMLEAIRRLQLSSLELLQRRYGFAEPHRITVKLQFPDDFPDEHGKIGEFTFELAPSYLQPHAVFNFLEMIRQTSSSKTSIIDSHLKMVDETHAYMVQYNTDQRLAFAEYSPEYPHNGEGTVCYLRGGPGWFINLADNSKNSPAETCFGIVVDGMDQIQRMKLFKRDHELNSSDTVHILAMTVQVPNQDGSYKEWVEPVNVSRRVL